MRREWTAAMDAALRAHYAAGLAHSQIAERLGVSKNATIGRAHRLRLGKRRAAIPPRRADLLFAAPRRGRITLAGEAKIKPLKITLEPPPFARVTILQVTECRAPVAVMDGLHVFCNATRTKGSSYCAYHRALYMDTRSTK